MSKELTDLAIRQQLALAAICDELSDAAAFGRSASSDTIIKIIQGTNLGDEPLQETAVSRGWSYAEIHRQDEAIKAAQSVMVEAFERNELPDVFAIMDYTRLAIEAYLKETGE